MKRPLHVLLCLLFLLIFCSSCFLPISSTVTSISTPASDFASAPASREALPPFAHPIIMQPSGHGSFGLSLVLVRASRDWPRFLPLLTVLYCTRLYCTKHQVSALAVTPATDAFTPPVPPSPSLCCCIRPRRCVAEMIQHDVSAAGLPQTKTCAQPTAGSRDPVQALASVLR